MNPTPYKCQLSVCPHDTAKNVTGWFFLNTYLQRKLACSIHFEPKDSFLAERQAVLDGGFHLVYANPFSAATFCRDRGFVPVARPVGVYDEAVLVQANGTVRPEHGRLRVASATDKLTVHGQGLSLLGQRGINLSDCDFEFVGTHVKAAHAVIQGKADLGIVYNETWAGMAESSRQSLTVLGMTDSRQLFHCFCVAAEWADKRGELLAVLCGMKNDPKGQAILDDLRFPMGFAEVQAHELEPARQLL